MSTVNIPVYERQLAAVLPEEMRAWYFMGEVPATMSSDFEEWKAKAFLEGGPPPTMTDSNLAKLFLRSEALKSQNALGSIPLSIMFPMSSAPITALHAPSVRRAAVSGHTTLTRKMVDMAIQPADVTPISARDVKKLAETMQANQPKPKKQVNVDQNLLDFFKMRGNAKFRKDLMINVSLEEAHGAKGLAERVERRMSALGEAEQAQVRRLLNGESPEAVAKPTRTAKPASTLTM
ncbi:hypothetical protein [Vogesella sp. XCS3]|uniref:hypothetical protein n=1 Tax=Vogesella sp. XCS3 TaxID=2877939 RepID=UPI001D0A8F16|nr:hypothetical protein [Vogesella sp. XCS3]UDM18943.1 hypothetical protein LCH97_18030 [Vogesella sp. XCS3]